MFNKKLVILPNVTHNKLDEFISNLTDIGIDMLYIEPRRNNSNKFTCMFPSKDADYIILEKNMIKIPNKILGKKFKIESNLDIDKLIEFSDDINFVIIEVVDWKIIPLENIIAKLHKIDIEIFVLAKNTDEVKKMFSILEIGVDGVIFETSSIEDTKKIMTFFTKKIFELTSAKVTEIKEVGDGERVCVDTISILHKGEGMLIGNKANFLFLVHNESVGSSFTSPRPFRVNAGAVHCYTLTGDQKTMYLSEIESGKEVRIIDENGQSRIVAVGRSKIEKRPMIMIKARTDKGEGDIVVQNAETIRLIRSNKEIVSVTDIKRGDEILIYSKPIIGRHFGMEVNEYILEK